MMHYGIDVTKYSHFYTLFKPTISKPVHPKSYHSDNMDLLKTYYQILW